MDSIGSAFYTNIQYDWKFKSLTNSTRTFPLESVRIRWNRWSPSDRHSTPMSNMGDKSLTFKVPLASKSFVIVPLWGYNTQNRFPFISFDERMIMFSLIQYCLLSLFTNLNSKFLFSTTFAPNYFLVNQKQKS